MIPLLWNRWLDIIGVRPEQAWEGWYCSRVSPTASWINTTRSTNIKTLIALCRSSVPLYMLQGLSLGGARLLIFSFLHVRNVEYCCVDTRTLSCPPWKFEACSLYLNRWTICTRKVSIGLVILWGSIMVISISLSAKFFVRAWQQVLRLWVLYMLY